MAVKLNEAGVFALERMGGDAGRRDSRRDPERPYYESWLAALERLVEAKGVMTEAERLARVDAWDRAAKATPHGQPITLSRG